MQRFLTNKLFLNGEWRKASSTFRVFNPFTGEKIGDAADCSRQDAKEAVNVARETFPKWKKTCAKERAAILKRWGCLMLENKDQLVELVTSENGKPTGESVNEVGFAASYLEWCAEESRRSYGITIPSPDPRKRLMSVMQPVGVAAMITPWNIPLAAVTRKAGAAIAAGCTVVLKPAEDTPFSALALAELAAEAGLPPGVFNVLPSSRLNAQEVGAVMCEHPDVATLSFTGSTGTGKKLLQQAAGTVKKVGMELGGLGSFIVFESANLDSAIKSAMACKFRYMGQNCYCPNRFYIHEAVHDAFVQKMAAVMKRDLKIGDPKDRNVTFGPLINDRALAKVEDHVKDAVGKGAEVVIGGKRGDLGGLFFDPTLITDVTSGMKCYNEETFGPLVSVIKFKTEEEVVAAANSTRMGLGGYFFSEDVTQCWRVAEEMEVGMVGVNEGAIGTAEAPYGGVKESGLGREGGFCALDEFLEIKYICWGDI